MFVPLSLVTTFCGVGWSTASSDHGWQLGDLGEFGKKTNFERATRAPLLIKPVKPAGASRTLSGVQSMGQQTDVLAEFVDIMPTLLDLAGLPVPPLCPEVSRSVALCTEGVSLRPVVENPAGSSDFKQAAFMQVGPTAHLE